MKETFRTRLKRGETLIGTLITLPSPEIAEILAGAGFDWLFVDLEHSTMGPHEAQLVLQAAGERVDCILRVPLNDEIWIKKALDTGAAGIMVPLVNSAEDARRAVRLSKYPPQGTRSVGLTRAHGYGMSMQEYLDHANENIAVIVQIEHIQAVHNVEEIIAVEGVDAALVGPYDLSASMNLMGQVTHPEVKTAIERVRLACQARGLPLGIYAAGAERARAYQQEGFTLIAAGLDAQILAQAARAIVKTLREAS